MEKRKRILKKVTALVLAAALVVSVAPVSFMPDVAEAADTIKTGQLLGDADSGFYVNMPAVNTPDTAPDIDLTPVLNAGATSVKVYDNGGKDRDYSDNCCGYLVLTAPEGYVFKLTGSLRTEMEIQAGIPDYLSVYDGTQPGATPLLDQAHSPGLCQTYTIPNPIFSNGRKLKFQFISSESSYYDGLDLTVTMVRDVGKFAINCNAEAGGTVTSDVQEARPGSVISLTAHPANGYLPEEIRVVNTLTNEPVELDRDVQWYDSEPVVTFVMPEAPVSVSGLFSCEMTGRSINMPSDESVKNVTIPSGVTSFKVYDDGGEDEDYSPNCRGYLLLTAPQGYKLALSGTVETEGNTGGLYVYDSSENKNPVAGSPFRSGSNGIGLIQSSANCLYLYFSPTRNHTSAGLNLTVNVYHPNQQYDIVLPASSAHGTVSANANKAKAGDTITLTPTPEEGYLLSSLIVTELRSGTPIKITRGDFLFNTATFTMPASDVSVTPVFSDDKTGLSLNMPVTGSLSGTVPEGISSFIVYCDGGPDGFCSANCDGTLTLTVPEGHVIQITKKIKLDPSNVLSVYDGPDTNSTLLYCYTGKNIPSFVTTGRSVTIHFKNGENYNEDTKFMLTAEVIDIETPHTLTIENPESGGVVTAFAGSEAVASAAVNTEVTLTASPESGYKLSELEVVDDDGKAYDVGWHGSFEESVTFSMPTKNLTIRPGFTHDLTAEGGIYINMPKTGNLTVDAEALSGVTSFKVYDDGGVNGCCSNGCDGTLTLSAASGMVFYLEGWYQADSYSPLVIYDGPDVGSTTLVEAKRTSTNESWEMIPISAASTGNQVTFHLKTSSSLVTLNGLNLTVTVCNPDQTYSLSTPEEITGGRIGITVGGVAVSEAQPGKTVTVTATPESGYVFDGITVKNGDRTVTSQGGWFADNKATFIMPVGDVRITPVFRRGNCSIPIPDGSRSVLIPSGVTSVRINGYEGYGDSLLTLTASADHVIHLSGSFLPYTNSQTLTVYDGRTDSGDVLYSMGNKHSVYTPDVVTTDSSITIKTEQRENEIFSNLVATVGRGIRTADNLSHGSVSTDKSFATDGETVTVTPLADTCYEVDTVSYNDGSDHVITPDAETGKYTFTVSDTTSVPNITVSATFKWIPQPITPVVDITGWTYGNTADTPCLTSGNPGEGEVTYAYYTDAACTTKTNAENSGAASEGGVPMNAGTWYVKATVAATERYLSGTGVAEFTISKAPLTVTAKDAVIDYGDPLTGNGVTYEGFVNDETEDTVGVLGGTLSYTGNYSQYGDVGEYTITPCGLTADNYDIRYVAGRLTVYQREVVLSWAGTSVTYDRLPHVPTATVTNAVNGDTIGVTVTVTGEHVNAGSYTATATGLTGTKAGNYMLSEEENTTVLRINKATAPAIPTVTKEVPVTSTIIEVSIAGMMPADAGDLVYGSSPTVEVTGNRRVLGGGTDSEKGIINVDVDEGAEPATITVPACIRSTNYNDAKFNVVIKLVDNPSGGGPTPPPGPNPTTKPTAPPKPTTAPTVSPAPTGAPTALPIPTTAPTASAKPTSTPSGGGGGTGGGGGGSNPSPTSAPAPTAAPAPSVAPSAAPTAPSTAPSAAPTTAPAPSAVPSAVPPETTTTTNPDGSTTTTTTETDAAGTKTTETETVKPDGTIEKTTEIVTADGSTEKTKETVKANGASQKTTDIEKSDGTTIHAEVTTTAKGKETSKTVETSPNGSTIVTVQTTQPSGDYTKVALNTTIKTDEAGNIIGATVTIETEQKNGDTTQKASFVLIDLGKKAAKAMRSQGALAGDPADVLSDLGKKAAKEGNLSGLYAKASEKLSDADKKLVALTETTTTEKDGIITIPKTVTADGETYTVAVLKKGMLKGNKNKPKKLLIKASGITGIEKGAFKKLAKKGTIKIKANKKDYKRIKNLIIGSGLPKGVTIKHFGGSAST